MVTRRPDASASAAAVRRLKDKTVAYLCKHRGARLARTGSGTDRQCAAPADPGAHQSGPAVELLSAAGKAIRSLPVQVFDHLVSDGLVERDPAGLWRATGAAHARLARTRTGENAFLFQHLDIASADVARISPGMAEADGAMAKPTASASHGARRRRTRSGGKVLIDLSESPVARLARPGRRRGQAFLDPASVMAAERFRADFERAHLQPRLTTDWSAAAATTKHSTRTGDRLDLSNAVLAARFRVDRAVAAVGPEFGGVLVDVCGHVKGLETIERERRWPARSAKLVLKFALAALARHYGLAPAASGTGGKGIRRWATPDYRPSIDAE